MEFIIFSIDEDCMYWLCGGTFCCLLPYDEDVFVKGIAFGYWDGGTEIIVFIYGMEKYGEQALDSDYFVTRISWFGLGGGVPGER